MKNIHVLPTDKPSRLYKSKITQGVFISDNMSQHGDATYNVNIYITSDEEIKEGDYFLYDETEIRYKTNGTEYHGRDLCHISGNRRYPVNKSKKIILTTDQNLDGVQKIDDEFLQWFVKNPSCEEVAVEREMYMPQSNGKISDGKITHEISLNPLVYYKIIIPKEEPKQTDEKGGPITFREGIEESKYIMSIDPYDKQETLEEFIEREGYPEGHTQDIWETGVRDGIAWQQEQERMYSEEEVLKLLIYCKDKFGGSGLEDYVYDSEVKDWFEQLKKK